MGLTFATVLSASVVLFAVFSNSPSFTLQNYSIGQGASTTTASATYNVALNSGEIVGQSSNSTGYSAKSGELQAQQAAVPPAPTLDNGSNTYYNKLKVTINTGGNASDATFSIAVSSNNFVTTNYVQVDGSLSAVPLFQTYAQWGAASGTTIVGLTPSTAYLVKVSAMQGKFTHSAYGPSAALSTVNSTISFSLSTNALSMASLLPGSVITSPGITASVATNANFGASVYVADSNAGLKSTVQNHTIASATGALGSLSNGYGMQSSAVSQTSGGPLASASPYNGTGTTVGLLSTTWQTLFSSPSAITGGSGTVSLLAKSSATDASASDYADVLTFLTSARY